MREEFYLRRDRYNLVEPELILRVHLISYPNKQEFDRALYFWRRKPKRSNWLDQCVLGWASMVICCCAIIGNSWAVAGWFGGAGIVWIWFCGHRACAAAKRWERWKRDYFNSLDRLVGK